MRFSKKLSQALVHACLAGVACSQTPPSSAPLSVMVSSGDSTPETSTPSPLMEPARGCPDPTQLGVAVRIGPLLNQPEPRVMWVQAQPAGVAPARAEVLTLRAIPEAGREPDPSRSLPVWVMRPESPPCPMTQGESFLLIGNEPWAWLPLVVTELVGACDVTEVATLAARQIDSPTGCHLVAPMEVTRNALVDDASAPPLVAAAFDAASCQGPCDFRRRVVGHATARGQRLEWSVAAHVHPVAGVSDECQWPHEDYLWLLARSASGAVTTLPDAYGLDEVMVENNNIVGFVDRGIGSLAIWSWRAATPTRDQVVQFGWAHEEDNEALALSEYCGP